VSAGTAASVSFVVESSVGVSTKYHVASLIGDTVVWVREAVVEQVMNDFFCFCSYVCLTSGDGVEGS